ncbi:MAG: tetratricopeptide repeat protein, partial [Chthoniobacterales bacterium]
MKIRKFATISLLVLSSFAANNVAPSKAELESMYDRAFKEFNANNYDQALKELDGIDARQPDLAESQNLRGVICMRQQKYDDAEKALQKALATDPKFWNARFNLAEIPFLRKNWTEARNRFQGLLFGNDLQLQGEALQLIQYKVLLTYLLEGKENMVDSIMAKLELAPDTPAVHYANAAVAFQRKNDKEARDWVDKAEKNFSPQLNKLFAESLYEVGWMEKPAGQGRSSVELTSAADRAAKAKAFAKSKFEQAEQAFQQRDFTAARKALDEADAADPNQPAYVNFRGEILLAQKDFEGAEAAFRQALKVDPKFREAQYNLAQIPFKKKEYTKARERYEALFNSTPAPGGDKNQAGQLIKFKIYLTLLLEGKDSAAQKMMEQFQFTGDTPALYYARSAWEFKHGNAAKGNDWVTSARKIYSPAMNMVFADAFYDLGWLQNASPAAAQASSELAKVESTPSIEPTPIPGAAVAANAGKQPAQTQKAAEKAAEKGVPGMEATTQSSPVVVAQNKVDKAAPTPAAAVSPSVETPNAANALPEESRAPLPPETEQSAPAATQAPVIASTGNEPASGTAAPAASATGAPQVATTAVSATPATVLAPAQVREWSQPSASDSFSRFLEPRALLAGGLFLGGVAILGYLGLQGMRRRAARAPMRHVPAPVTAPKFGPAIRPTAAFDERIATRTAIIAGPRQISLQLKASEPSVRRAAVPFSKSNRVFGAGSGSSASLVTSRTERTFAPEPESAVAQPSEAVGGAVESDVASETEPVTARAHEATPESFVQPPPAFEPEAAFAHDGYGNGQHAANGAPEDVVPVFEPAELPPSFVDPMPASIEPEPVEPPPADFVAEPAVEESAAAEMIPAAEAEPETTFVDAAAVSEPMTESAPTFDAPPEPLETAESEIEPIGQGQPVPHLIPAGEETTETVEDAPPAPQPSRFAKLVAAGAALAGVGALRRSSASEEPQVAPPPIEPQPQVLAPAPVSDEPTPFEPLTQQTTPTEIMAPPNQPIPAPMI